MSMEVVTRPPHDKRLSFWSDLPDVSTVSDGLSRQDQNFFEAVGARLAESQQAGRFAIILLHSHFVVERHETLVERFLPEHGAIVTSVQGMEAIEADISFVPRAWMFDEYALADGGARLKILAWADRDDLIEQRPLDGDDSRLMQDLGALFRRFGVTQRFGMTLADYAPANGMIWTEGETLERRELVQQQLPRAEVQARDPLITVWNFDSEGRSFSGRKCCLPLAAGGGHSRRKHPGG